MAGSRAVIRKLDSRNKFATVSFLKRFDADYRIPFERGTGSRSTLVRAATRELTRIRFGSVDRRVKSIRFSVFERDSFSRRPRFGFEKKNPTASFEQRATPGRIVFVSTRNRWSTPVVSLFPRFIFPCPRYSLKRVGTVGTGADRTYEVEPRGRERENAEIEVSMKSDSIGG